MDRIISNGNLKNFKNAYRNFLRKDPTPNKFNNYINTAAYFNRYEMFKILVNEKFNRMNNPELSKKIMNLISSRPKLLNYLLKKGIKIPNNHISLVAVSVRNNKIVAKKLIDSGINVNTMSNGITPLFAAARIGNNEMVSFLIKEGANINKQMTTAWGKGQTALHIASCHGHVRVVSLLIHHGADINIRSDEGLTPLQLSLETYMSKRRHNSKLNFKGSETLQLLLDKHIKNKNNVKNNLNNTKLYNGVTPLWIAASECDNKLVELLLKAGVNVNGKVSASGYKQNNLFRNEMRGQTALHAASYYGAVSTAEILLKHGADIQVRDRSGNLPIEFAIKNKKPKMVKLLLERHIKDNTFNTINKTILNFKNTNIQNILKKHHKKVVSNREANELANLLGGMRLNHNHKKEETNERVKGIRNREQQERKN